MLPLLRDRVGIAVCPDRIISVRLRSARGRIVHKSILPVRPGSGGPSWRSVTDALAQSLQSSETGNADAVVVLSNHFFRYATVAWNGAIADAAEAAAFLLHGFVQTYGTAAQGWELRMDSRHRAPIRIASGIDGEFIGAVRAVFAGHPSRLLSVQPYWMAAANTCRKLLTGESAWFAVAEPGRLCLSLFEAGQWRHIGNRACLDTAQIPALLDRENMISGISQPCRNLFLFAPELEGAGVTPEGYNVQLLPAPSRPGLSMTGDAPYAMALAGFA